MASIAVRFKLVGPNAGKTIVLGPKKQYHFIKGLLDFECPAEDAPKHAGTLLKFYSAKRVKPGKGAAQLAEEILPDADDDDDEESPVKKASKKTK